MEGIAKILATAKSIELERTRVRDVGDGSAQSRL